MKSWEDLKEYEPLKKNTIRKSFKDFFLIIGRKLKLYGFQLMQTSYKSRLFRISNDIIEVIEFQNNDPYRLEDENFSINVGLLPLCWEFSDLDNLMATKSINEVDKSIKNYSIITKEYHLLADYIYQRLVSEILPYFEKYNTTQKVVESWQNFEYKTTLGGEDIQNSHFLILFSELKQQKLRFTNEILDNQIVFWKKWYIDEPDINGRMILKRLIKKWEELQKYVQDKNWEIINMLLLRNEKNTLEKLQKYYWQQ